MTCPSCGSSAPDGAKFCPNCGQLLASAKERRIVTVLFADLVGFTAFSETLDPERAKHVVDRYFERLVADVNAFGGKIDKILGDGLLALFGAPIAHEDDAERAVRAGLRMQRTVLRMSQELDLSLQLRIGVNTGEVLVGASQVGTDYTAMGDTVNTASRLEALTTPGEVWVGPDTHELTHDAIQYEPRGSVVVRGRSAEMEVFAAVRELTLPGRRRHRNRAALVGRDTEMAVLQSAVADSAERGHAYLLMVLGDAGMGKGRAVEELVLAAEAQHEAFVLEGRCLPYGETSPWWPIGESLRELFQVEDSDTDEEVAGRVTEFVTDVLEPGEDVSRVVVGLRHLMGDEDALSELDRSRAAQEATRSLQQFLAAHGRETLVMLVLYDLQWADRVLLDMLERMLEGLRESCFTAVTTNRWTAGEERWTGNAGRHNTVLLNLLPLSERSTARLAGALLGAEVPDYLARDLYERSGGNPFFLEELTALMSEVTATPAGRRMDATGPIVKLPDTLRGLVAARIDGLPPAERSMVDEASVIGVDGPIYALLMYLESEGFENPGHAFDQLVTKDIFETDGQGWRFRSDLVREVAYATLTKTDRIQRHSVIAEWLEGRLDPESMRLRDVARIAYHYSAAAKLAREFSVLPSGVPEDLLERTLLALERSGEIAQRVDSNYSAGKSFHRLLKLTPQDQFSRRAGAHLGRASARLSLREMVGARDDAESALSLAVEANDASQEARALIL
ncbi:MAG: adenylate/guanylate cyclase domain-containing protein, partial [Acidimicrobiales bacterium]